MSVKELKTKILTAFENEIRVSFLLIVMYHVKNTCTNFKQKIAKEKYVRKGFSSKICSLNVMSVTWDCPCTPYLHESLQLLLEIKQVSSILP